jgi:imidazole glycerol-phosphate synthase subunit HisH
VLALIDYGAGNLASVRKGLAAVGADVFTPGDPSPLAEATGVIVPGVGNFDATRAIDNAWRTAILSAVDRGVPLLGICLGMQYLFEGSDEAPGVPGLGLMRGTCALLPPTVKVPHVGWNSLALTRPSALLDTALDDAQVYFTHSYAAPVTPDCVATSEHGAAFAAAVERGRVFGVQFHPEKSSDAGLRILRAFVAITRSRNRHITKSLPC